MEIVTKQFIDEYLVDDRITQLMDDYAREGDEDLTCQKWLRDSAPKRAVFKKIYGALLLESEGHRVLDIGGGLTSFTHALAARHDYILIDLMAHDDELMVDQAAAKTNKAFIHAVDWYDFAPKGTYDVVIANDLFPNVDQRLELFLEKFLPVSKEIRLSLTYYPDPRFYMTRRIVGEEFLCMLAWTGELTALVLKKYQQHLQAPDMSVLTSENASVYPNRRQVCILSLKGLAV